MNVDIICKGLVCLRNWIYLDWGIDRIRKNSVVWEQPLISLFVSGSGCVSTITLLWLFIILIVNKLASDTILAVEFLVKSPTELSLILLRQIKFNVELVFTMSECTLKTKLELNQDLQYLRMGNFLQTPSICIVQCETWTHVQVTNLWLRWSWGIKLRQ